MTRSVDSLRSGTDAKRKQRAKTISPKLTTIRNMKLPSGASMYSLYFSSPSQTMKGKKYKVTFRSNPKKPITRDN